MFKNHSVWEEKNGEEIQRFECTPGTSAAAAYDFLTRVRSHVFGIIQAEEDKVKQATTEGACCEKEV